MPIYVPAVSLEAVTLGDVASGTSTMPRRLATSASIGSGTGRLRFSYFTPLQDRSVSSVRIITGTTAGTLITLARVGLYSEAANGDLTLIAAVANDVTLFIAAGTSYTRNLDGAVTLRRGQRYAMAPLVVTVGTAPTFGGAVVAGNGSDEALMAPAIGSTITGATDLPSSVAVASLTGSGSLIYGVFV